MSRRYPKYKGKILGRKPDPAADAKQRSINDELKKIAQEQFLDTMTPEERKQYLAEGRRLKEISDMAISNSKRELELAKAEFERRQQDKLALIGPLNQRLAAAKAQAAAAAAAPVVSQEELVKARIVSKLEADIVNYITPKYRENAETILGNFFDTANYDEPYELGIMKPSLDNYQQIASYWIEDIERRIESGELLDNGGGGGAVAMSESMDDDDDDGPQRDLGGGKKSRKSRKSKKSKKSKKSRKARQSKRSKTRKHL